MAENIKINKPNDITITIRRAESKDVFILSMIYAFLVCLILNILFFLMNKDNYLKNITSISFFSLLSTSIVVFISTIIYSYTVFIESVIQSRKKKYYYRYEDNAYSTIFSIPISIIFALITSIYLLIAISNYMNIGKNFSINLLGTITIIIIIFIPVITNVYLYYFKLTKILLYQSLLLKEKFFSTIKEEIDSEIYAAKMNHLDLWLITLKILNIDEISEKIKTKKKKLLDEIIYNFKHNVKSTDYIITLNYLKGIMGYIIKNIDPTIVDNFIKGKILPLLEKEMIVNNIHIDLKIEYSKENISKNAEIESISDIISTSK